MNIIAFLTSYIFDRDSKKAEPEEATEETVVAFNDEHEQMISHHIDFIMELGFSRESARRALEVSWWLSCYYRFLGGFMSSP